MNETDIQKLRHEYTKLSLDESQVDPNPFNQFRTWFQEAIKAKVAEPNAFNFATVDANGKPHQRILLLKGLEGDKFKFYTNYSSAKANEIVANPNVSLNFFWMELERQVRIDGIARKLPLEESEAYFRSRPHLSQIGAHSSNQSEVVPNRQYLEEKFKENMDKFEEGNVPLPETWGGYEIVPNFFEFWQGRPSRFHDRITYRILDGNWEIKRLSP